MAASPAHRYSVPAVPVTAAAAASWQARSNGRRAGHVPVAGAVAASGWRSGADRQRDFEDDSDELLGIPKIVWVILLDVLGLACFLGCIYSVLFLSKRRAAGGDGGGLCA